MTTPESAYDENERTVFEEKIQLPFFSSSHKTVSLAMFESVLNARREEALSEIQNEVAEAEQKKADKDAYLNNYMAFLDGNRTVREVNRATAELAKSRGFVDYDDLMAGKAKGRKVIFHSEDWQNVALVVLGDDDLAESGLRIMAAHADAPRLDLKANPIKIKKNEKGEPEKGQALLDTHYYGGFMKGEWFGPYQLRGELVEEKDGRITTRKLNNVNLVLPPLLIHLNADGKEKKVVDAYPADKMDMITGLDTEQQALEAIGLSSSKDFAHASIEIVPSEPVTRANDVVYGYGQDDRVCLYAQVRGILDSKDTKKTKIVMNFDKEEIGSEGTSSARSVWVDSVIARTVRLKQSRSEAYASQRYWVRRDKQSSSEAHASQKYDLLLDENAFINEVVLPKSMCVSADVSAGYHLGHEEKFDPQNSSHLGDGVTIERYTGHGGKYEASEASAETMFRLTHVLDKANVKYQERMLSGKLDVGGGGTVAKYFAQRGIATLDGGVPLLGMHSRVETAHVDDIDAQYRMSLAFLES